MAGHSINSKILLVRTFIALVFLTQTQCGISDGKNALTFQWYDEVSAEKFNFSDFDQNHRPTRHLAEYSRLYKQIKSAFILQATNFTTEFPDSIGWIQSAGFVDTVFYSYQKHHNLIIRPDDIWTAIVVQFSLYINANAEELRHLFVNFKGSKELNVFFVSPIDRVPVDDFIRRIVNLINEHIHPSINQWISPNFTTTTENDRLTVGVAFMATVKKYFDYGLFSILCGIPQVTILGDVDDWKDIRHRVDSLKLFELNGKDVMKRWSFMLSIILDQIISVKKGNTKDDLFWRQAIRVDYKESFGCGRDQETSLNGWITTFSAFDKLGHWQEDLRKPFNVRYPWLSIPTNTITPGIVQVPIKIYDEYAQPEERQYSGAILAGHMGYSVNKDETTLQPLSGWAMTITKNPPQYLRYKISSRPL